MTFEEAINYPRSGEDPLRTVLIGGVLTLLGFLVIPIVLVLGYLMRVIRTTLADDPDPPAFEGWGELFRDGLYALVVAFVYLLIPAVVFGITVGGIAINAFLTGEVGFGTIAGSLVGFSLTALIGLLVWYVVPAALANVAAKDRIGAGFAFGELRSVIFTERYATAWLLALVVFIAGGIVVGILDVIPPLGFVAGGFVFFYVDVVAFRLYGRAYAEAGTREPAPEPPAGQPVA
jgi:hypothetical protein